MAGRFSLISAAVFAGVVVAGGLVSSGALNPADALNSLRGNDSSVPQVVQDQSAVAGSATTSEQQTTEASFAPLAGSQRQRESGEHRDSSEHHDDGDKNERDDD